MQQLLYLCWTVDTLHCERQRRRIRCSQLVQAGVWSQVGLSKSLTPSSWFTPPAASRIQATWWRRHTEAGGRRQAGWPEWCVTTCMRVDERPLARPTF